MEANIFQRSCQGRNKAFSRKQSWPILQSYSCFLSGRPQLAVRARDTDGTPRGPLKKELVLTSLRSRLILCGTRLRMGDGKLMFCPMRSWTLSPGLENILSWSRGPLCEIAAFALGGEHCAPGFPRTVDMSTGAKGGHLEGTSCPGFSIFSQHVVPRGCFGPVENGKVA